MPLWPLHFYKTWTWTASQTIHKALLSDPRTFSGFSTPLPEPRQSHETKWTQVLIRVVSPNFALWRPSKWTGSVNEKNWGRGSLFVCWLVCSWSNLLAPSPPCIVCTLSGKTIGETILRTVINVNPDSWFYSAHPMPKSLLLPTMTLFGVPDMWWICWKGLKP